MFIFILGLAALALAIGLLRNRSRHRAPIEPRQLPDPEPETGRAQTVQPQARGSPLSTPAILTTIVADHRTRAEGARQFVPR